MKRISEILLLKSKEMSIVADAVKGSLPQIERAVEAVLACRKAGGRVIFLEESVMDQSVSERVSDNDVIFAVSANGLSNRLLDMLRSARRRGLCTACITYNPASVITEIVQYPIVPLLGKVRSEAMEKLATELVLDMLQSCMEDIEQESEQREAVVSALLEKGVNDIMSQTGITEYAYARELLLKYGSVHKAVEHYKNV